MRRHPPGRQSPNRCPWREQRAPATRAGSCRVAADTAEHHRLHLGDPLPGAVRNRVRGALTVANRRRVNHLQVGGDRGMQKWQWSLAFAAGSLRPPPWSQREAMWRSARRQFLRPSVRRHSTRCDRLRGVAYPRTLHTPERSSGQAPWVESTSPDQGLPEVAQGLPKVVQGAGRGLGGHQAAP